MPRVTSTWLNEFDSAASPVSVFGWNMISLYHKAIMSSMPRECNLSHFGISEDAAIPIGREGY